MFNYLSSLYATDLAAVWESIPLDEKTILSITVGTKTITPQKQFETFFKGRRLKDNDTEDAEILFFAIYDGNRWLIEKIKKQKEIIAGLVDFGNWADVVDTTGKTTTDTTTKSDGNSKNVSSNANTDNNSFVNDEQIKLYMATDENRGYAPANVVIQSAIKDERSDAIKTDNVLNTTGKTSSSNSSVDFITFHGLKLGNLKEEFWGCFNRLFI